MHCAYSPGGWTRKWPPYPKTALWNSSQPTAVSEPHCVFSKVPAVAATCRLWRHCGRERRSLDAVAHRKATRAASWVAAGSRGRLLSRSVKRVHLEMCPAVKESLAQVGDTPGCCTTSPVPVESGYGRQQKVFCQRVIANIATYNVCTLKAK